MNLRRVWAISFSLAIVSAFGGCGGDAGGDAAGGDTAQGPTPDTGSPPDSGPMDADVVVIRACGDGLDNDGDGRTDLEDTGCADAADDDESEPALPACANQVDDDLDGRIDREDPGCAGALDADESDDPMAAACSDGADNDADGYTDYPADPGCGSDLDGDETDSGAGLPECVDGNDNDRDGAVDLQDPGCSTPADPREEDPPNAPACSNRVDDDGDGIVDFPLDPGCQAAGDNEEMDTGVPDCGNGLADDRDGRLDYPDDPGCAGVGDHDETDPPVAPACADGADNDADGDVDYPTDTGCESAGDGNEIGSCGLRYRPIELVADQDVATDTGRGVFVSEGTCGGRGAAEVVFVFRVEGVLETLRIRTDRPGTEAETTLYVRRGCLDEQTEVACGREPIGDGVAANVLELAAPAPGDYFIFVDGATGNGGPVTLRIEAVPTAACRNEVDDDTDGRIDFPSDPGCTAMDDRDEADPAALPACADDVDNDGDGLVDFPLDLGCQAAADEDETDACGNGVPVTDYPVGVAFIVDDNLGGSNAFEGSCGGARMPEKIIRYANPFNARLTFSVDHEETAANTLLYVRRDCVGAELPMACSLGLPPNQRGRIRIDQAPPGDYFIFVDRQFGAAAPFKLSVDVERLPSGCADGRDNDGDAAVDAEDLGCTDPLDEDEADPMIGPDGLGAPACGNALDDDGDGAADFPFDPGCIARGDADEADPAPPPACANRLDDDADGVVDFPAEPGCQGRGDDDETNPRVAGQCTNRLDDDQDALSDYPNDPGCTSAGDTREEDPERAPTCANGEDDDRDGLGDFPFDSGCEAASDPDEANPAERADRVACDNGLDDDGDGVIDFPREPGCAFAGDPDETDGNAMPQCANARDDDGDARQDFPDDPGCRFAADNSEVNEGALPPRCADGIDNDDDGFPDALDVGCVDLRDNDEADPEPGNLPYCADGRDNDGDGTIDWPADEGCAAQGDVCEEAGYGFCGGVCLELTANPNHCGRCGRACSAGVACINGRCGAIRPRVLACGAPGRPVEEFIRGELVEAEVRVEAGCVPDDDTQAIVMARGGVGEVVANMATIRPWLEDGGQLLTEWNTTDEVYNAVFGAAIQPGVWNGGCQDNVQPLFQFSPDDPFWQDNLFVPVPDGATACGYAIPAAQIPDFVPLGGWDANNVEFGYVEVDAGRLWLIEADWQDREGAFTDASRDLMAYMIAGGRRAPRGPACGNGRDDDRDGLADRADPGCEGLDDADEVDPVMAAACANGVDDDRDGLADFPTDAGCAAAGDPDEANVGPAPACGNGADDDGDGRTDFPFDAGCAFAADESEADPAALPACGDAVDNDADGRVDFPDDPGCHAAADPDEANVGAPPPRCADAIDNDLDGAVGGRDLGCTGPADDDEANPAPGAPPFCADGLDNDGDGAVDWPDDDGCGARGGECEDAGRGRCGDVCIDLSADPLNCGRCGRVCAEGVASDNGRCGGLRLVVMSCGGSPRVQEFIRGPLAQLGLAVEPGCVPDERTQAVVVSRGGIGDAQANAASLSRFITDGGQVISEFGISHALYNTLFGANIPQGARQGDCQDNVQPAVQLSPDDPFWRDNVFVPVGPGQTGCGYAIVGDQVPGFVALGGWSPDAISLGYLESGAGRYWFVESDWQDQQMEFTDTSRDLMAYMIGGGAVPIR